LRFIIKKLARAAKQILLLLDKIPAPVLFMDGDTEVIGCNKSFENFAYSSKDELIGNKVLESVPFELAERLLESKTILKEKSIPVHHWPEAIYRSGKSYDLFFSRQILGGKDYYYAYLMDVTGISTVNKALIESEKLNSSVVQNIPMGIAVLDNNLIIKHTNNNWSNICTLVDGDSVHCGKPGNCKGEKEVQEFFEKMQRLADGSLEKLEMLFTCPCGDVPSRYIAVFGNKVREDFDGIIISAFDVTEHMILQSGLQKRLEEEAQNLNEKIEELQAIYEGAVDGLVAVDVETSKIIRVNPAFCRMTGFEESEILGKEPPFFHAHEDNERLSRLLFKYLKRRKLHTRALPIRNIKGDVVYVDITTKNIDLSGRKALLAFVRDVTKELKDKEKRKILSKFPDSNPNPIIRMNRDGEILYSNTAAQTAMKYSFKNYGEKCSILNPDILADCLENNKSINLEVESSGSIFSCSVVPVKEFDSVYLYMEDITERKLYESSLLLSAKVFETASEAIIITDNNACIVDVNKAFTEITGYGKQEVMGQNPGVMKSGKHGKEFYKEMWDSLLSGGYWRGEVWDRKKDGSIYPKLLFISAIKDKQNNTTHYVGIFSDITKMKESEQYLQYLAHYDKLTGLPNRTLFNKRLEEAITNSVLSGDIVGMLYIGLDGFKTINEVFGHESGDNFLKQVGERLSDLVGDKDVVARFGGDEFNVMIQGVQKEKDLEKIIDNILKILREPFIVHDVETFVTASMGVALYPNDGLTADQLVLNSHTALNEAKSAGKNTYRRFSSQLNVQSMERMFIESSLRKAVDNDEFQLYYQPRVDVNTGKILGAEALIRWVNAQMGVISPGRFIPVAEETGLIVAIGDWVLETAINQAKLWKDSGYDLKVSINIAAMQFIQENLSGKISDYIAKAGISTEVIEIEITESTIMRDPELAVKSLRRLKDMGLSVAVDDFGTGYSSLSYLKKFPIDTLKLDKSFVDGIPEDSDDVAISRAVMTLAKSLGLNVTAEGVETAQQYEFLKGETCDEIQGYYFSRPIPINDFNLLLSKGGILKP